MAKIRFATEHDVPVIVELGRRMHAESPRFSFFEFSEEKAVETTCLALSDGLLLVAEQDGGVVGMIAGLPGEHFFSRARYICDLVCYVLPDYRGTSIGSRLVREWDKVISEADLDLAESILGISTEVQPERTKELYERLGYRLSGYIMVKDNVRAKH